MPQFIKNVFFYYWKIFASDVQFKKLLKYVEVNSVTHNIYK